MTRRALASAAIGARMALAVASIVAGCGSRSRDNVPLALWKDSSGQTWQAPLRTPPPTDPIWIEHPGAGVVLLCARTGKEVLVSDPDAWLAQRGMPNTRFRSKAGAPLILPPSTDRAGTK